MKMIAISITTLVFLFARESIATYRVDGMMCAMNCPKKVNESLNEVDGIKSCKVDFKTKTAIVVFDDEKINSDKIAKTISKSTYYKVNDLNQKGEPDSFWEWLFGKS